MRPGRKEKVYPPMTDRARELAAGEFDLASRIARKWGRAYPRHADAFESAACWRLCVAASTYRPNRGVPFGAHARSQVEGAMLHTLRAETRAKADALGFDAATLDPDRHADEPPAPWSELTRGLREREASVLELTYARDMEQNEVCAELGLTKSEAYKARTRGLASLRQRLGATG